MHTLILAASACTGSWQQQWKCGWKQPTTTAADAGAFAGHNVAPFLIVALIVVALIALSRRGKSSTAATSS